MPKQIRQYETSLHLYKTVHLVGVHPALSKAATLKSVFNDTPMQQMRVIDPFLCSQAGLHGKNHRKNYWTGRIKPSIDTIIIDAHGLDARCPDLMNKSDNAQRWRILSWLWHLVQTGVHIRVLGATPYRAFSIAAALWWLSLRYKNIERKKLKHDTLDLSEDYLQQRLEIQYYKRIQNDPNYADLKFSSATLPPNTPDFFRDAVLACEEKLGRSASRNAMLAGANKHTHTVKPWAHNAAIGDTNVTYDDLIKAIGHGMSIVDAETLLHPERSSAFSVFARIISSSLQIGTKSARIANSNVIINSGLSENIRMFAKATRDIDFSTSVTFHLNSSRNWRDNLVNSRFSDEADRLQVGFTLAEFDKVSEAEKSGFNQMDMLMVPSNFVKDIVSKHVPQDVPVYCVGKGIAPLCPDTKQRLPLRIDDAPYFAMIFDAHSGTSRKNPLALINAYLAGDFPGINLIIKATPCADTHWGDRKGERAQIRQIAAVHPRIYFIEELWPFQDIINLIAGAHSIVSPHRSEGFGYIPAYAMALGTPVITTDYGGTVDFCTAKTSFLVPKELIEVHPLDHMDNIEGAIWAEIDPDILMSMMNYVLNNTFEAKKRAFAGRKLMQSYYAPEKFKTRVERAIAQGLTDLDDCSELGYVKSNPTWRDTDTRHDSSS